MVSANELAEIFACVLLCGLSTVRNLLFQTLSNMQVLTSIIIALCLVSNFFNVIIFESDLKGQVARNLDLFRNVKNNCRIFSRFSFMDEATKEDLKNSSKNNNTIKKTLFSGCLYGGHGVSTR